jgi:hypothetical protein
VPVRESLPHEDPFDLLAFGEDEIGSMLEGLGSTFDEATPPEFEHSQTERDDETVHELFAEIATAFVRPLREFVAQVRLGRGGKDWVEPCLAACHSVKTAANGVGFNALSTHLEDFQTVLHKAEKSYGENPEEDEILREEISAAYDQLEQFLPKVFLIPDEQKTPESFIISSILKQVNGVGRPAIRRLFSAGVLTLNAYVTARPTDMAAAAGLPIAIAERIVERFRKYATEPRHRLSESEARQARIAGLKECLAQLHAEQGTFLVAVSNEWQDPSKAPAKVESRRRRQEIMWDVTVLLAELGETETLDKLVRLPFDRRIELLEEIIQQYA